MAELRASSTAAPLPIHENDELGWHEDAGGPAAAAGESLERELVGALRAIAQSGLAVALVGFDDFELADLVVPAVTVVGRDSYRMGARAAELAFERLDSPELPARRILVPTELVVRGSGEVPPS